MNYKIILLITTLIITLCIPLVNIVTLENGNKTYALKTNYTVVPYGVYTAVSINNYCYNEYDAGNFDGRETNINSACTRRKDTYNGTPIDVVAIAGIIQTTSINNVYIPNRATLSENMNYINSNQI